MIGGDAANGLDVDVTRVGGNVTVVQGTAANLKVDASGVTVPVSIAAAVDTELTTADLDLGGGTDTRAVVGLVGSKSGGGQLLPGDATAGLKVDLGTDNDVTVTGTVTANAGTNLNTSALALDATLTGGTQKAITRGGAKGATTAADLTGTAEGADHQGLDVQIYHGGTAKDPTAVRALTSADVVTVVVPAPLSTTGGGTEATAHRVTLANDSTGLVAVKQATASNLNATVVGTGTLAVQDSQVIADNAAFTDGTSKVLMAGFAFDETAGTALTENDAAAARIDSKRAVVGVIEDATTRGTRATVKAASTAAVAADPSLVVSLSPNNGLPTGSNTIGALTANQSVNAAQIGGVAPVVDNAAFTDGTTPVVAAGFIFDETAGTALTENDAAAARINANRAQVAVLEDETTRGRRATIKAASTAAVATDTSLVVSLNPNTSPAMPTGASATQVQGTVAIDGASAQNPVLNGARASTAIPAAVSADGDAQALWVDRSGTLITRGRPVATYTGVYRLAARPFALSWASGGAARKQFASLYHTAASTKRVSLLSIQVAIESASAAALVVAELNWLNGVTAPATGNPAIAPGRNEISDAAVEAAALCLPTTAGSEAGDPKAIAEWNLGITAAGTVVNPPPPLQWVYLWNVGALEEYKPLIMRAGVAEGWAVDIDASASATIKGFVQIVFTEE
jgi:hypothetical protein